MILPMQLPYIFVPSSMSKGVLKKMMMQPLIRQFRLSFLFGSKWFNRFCWEFSEKTLGGKLWFQL